MSITFTLINLLIIYDKWAFFTVGKHPNKTTMAESHLAAPVSSLSAPEWNIVIDEVIECLCKFAAQCSRSIQRCLSSANEGIQGEPVNDWPSNPGPHQAMLVLGQEGFSPHPLSVGGPGPRHRGPVPEGRSPLHIRRGDSARPVSLN